MILPDMRGAALDENAATIADREAQRKRAKW
jgi:hypothetical protein